MYRRKKLVRILLIIFIFIFMLLAIAALSMGIIFKSQLTEASNKIANFPVAPDFIVAIGAAGVIISFLGGYSAWKKNRVLLIIFVVLLTILLIMEVVVVVLSMLGVQDGELETRVRRVLEEELRIGNLEKWQRDLRCCGVTGARDYYKDLIPSSCCPDAQFGCNVANSYEGCHGVVFEEMRIVGVSIAIVGIVVSLALGIFGVLQYFVLNDAGELYFKFKPSTTRKTER